MADVGTYTDPRDGKTYSTVKIGEQVWMAENLDWEGSGVYYNNASSPPFAKAGRLYDWETAMKACPEGWHLPSNEEWDELVDFAGGPSVAGKHLKAASGWNNNGNGTDSYGFAALPGGNGDPGGGFRDAGNNGLWWSASEYNSYSAYYRYMNYYGEGAYLSYSSKTNVFSVRLIKDGEELGGGADCCCGCCEHCKAAAARRRREHEAASASIPLSNPKPRRAK